MATDYLATKLAPPPLRTHIVPRPRLLAQLDAGVSRGLTLISATAGFGKTTLVTEWLTHHGEEKTAPNGKSFPLVIWLALDENDNTPTRLLRHVGAALTTVAPEWGRDVSAQLDTNSITGLDITPDALLNELNALTEPCIVVMDDYHLITSPEVHAALGYALEHMPPQMHLMLLTRADPPLPLARLRARDQLVEIRAADLAFTLEEAAQFLNRVMGLNLTSEQVNALEKRTEGWIAGLQLAALSLRGAGNVNAFIENFTGNDRYIFDYLADEVIRKLDAATRTFLLQTSILDKICASLGDTVTGQRDAQSLLERLESDNLFTIPLDTHREWYRYHHLFRELLRHELRRTREQEIPLLHQRAAVWYEQHGSPTEAVQHWLAAREFERAASLIEANVISYLERAEFKTILGWLDALPQEYRENSPRIALVQVWVFMLNGEFELAQAQLMRTAERLTDPADIAQLEALRALFIGLRGDSHDRVASARGAYARAAGVSDFTRGISALNLGTSYLFEGELDDAFRVLGEAEELMQRAGNKALAVIAESGRADTEILRGQLKRAARRLEKVLAVQESSHTAEAAHVNSPLVGLAELDREWNHLDAAEQKLERARQHLNVEIGAPRFYLLYSAILRAKQNFNGAQEMLEQARLNTRRFSLPIFHTQWVAEQAALYLAQSRISDSAAWLATHNVTLNTPVTFLQEAELLALAQTLIAQNKLDDALSLLSCLADSTALGSRISRLAHTELLQALVYARKHETERSHALLLSALQRAEPEGYIRLFVERGAELAALLRSMTFSDPTLERYCIQLLAAFPPSPDSFDLPEALSERELEILNLVAQGLSNGEIADQLTLTPGTIKWHVNNIFGKLDVHSRTQAVARARQSKILA
jgi:LuxR family maltose regulon positive regulatory protein